MKLINKYLDCALLLIQRWLWTRKVVKGKRLAHVAAWDVNVVITCKQRDMCCLSAPYSVISTDVVSCIESWRISEKAGGSAPSPITTFDR